MDSRGSGGFGAADRGAAAHSFEEYAFRLFEVFGPARLVSGLFSSNLALGFAIANISLVLFGAWCCVARVRPGCGPGIRRLAGCVVLDLSGVWQRDLGTFCSPLGKGAAFHGWGRRRC